MIDLQDGDSIVFWAENEVASLTPEFRNRWRAVHRDGRVAHRPSPPAPGPWVPLGNSLVSPQWLTRAAEGWRDPAGFVFPPLDLPTPEPPAPEPDIPKIPCPRSQIYALQGHGNESLWLTDVGDFPWKSVPSGKAHKALPELVLARRGLYLNRRRICRVRHDYTNYYLDLDNGKVYRVTKQTEALCGRMGLPNLLWLEPRCTEMYGNYLLRDWPFELAVAPGEVLKSLFSSARQLIGHLIWQRLRYRQIGIEREWATSYRGFWYVAVLPALYRAGFLDTGSEELTAPTTSEELNMLLFQVMDFFVGYARLFTFSEFGFVEPRPDCRRIGKLRPEILLVAEKESFADYATKIAEEFGVSLRLLGSQPPLIGTEFLAKALAEVIGDRPVLVIAYVDYDTGGWIIGHAFAEQLERFGLKVSGVKFLIRQECFTDEEKRLYAHPCASGDKTHITKNKNWVKESGGLDGKAMGIHSNHVQPFERVRGLFASLLGT